MDIICLPHFVHHFKDIPAIRVLECSMNQGILITKKKIWVRILTENHNCRGFVFSIFEHF